MKLASSFLARSLLRDRFLHFVSYNQHYEINGYLNVYFVRIKHELFAVAVLRFL